MFVFGKFRTLSKTNMFGFGTPRVKYSLKIITSYRAVYFESFYCSSVLM